MTSRERAIRRPRLRRGGRPSAAARRAERGAVQKSARTVEEGRVAARRAVAATAAQSGGDLPAAAAAAVAGGRRHGRRGGGGAPRAGSGREAVLVLHRLATRHDPHRRGGRVRLHDIPRVPPLVGRGEGVFLHTVQRGRFHPPRRRIHRAAERRDRRHPPWTGGGRRGGRRRSVRRQHGAHGRVDHVESHERGRRHRDDDDDGADRDDARYYGDAERGAGESAVRDADGPADGDGEFVPPRRLGYRRRALAVVVVVR
mmetsp:Transcript_18575/g.44660  ORF Transcript_18575/g.44660 Transcript_18575/m.44660 type:complete len:257 (-) Transcript_18575:693-1463(-)